MTLAKRNKELGDTIAGWDKKFGAWACVAYHYSALHWIDAYLDDALQQHPKTHIDRNKMFQHQALLRTLYDDYYFLCSESRDARYNLSAFSDARISNVLDSLQKIEDAVNEALN